jgi:hypothetical protein
MKSPRPHHCIDGLNVTDYSVLEVCKGVLPHGADFVSIYE